MSNRFRKAMGIGAVLALFAVTLSLLTGLVMPKYSEDITEGGYVSGYYRNAGGNDVIFLGDCKAYASINPAVLFSEAGITSYVRGTPDQTICQSYYLLEETLRYETPKAVVFEVNMMKSSEPAKEEYNRLVLDYMRWSGTKVRLLRDTMGEDESFLSYLFPIMRYHGRIFELTAEDFRYLFRRKENTFMGHPVVTAVKEMTELPSPRKLKDYAFSEENMEYLDRMRRLCEEKGIAFLLLKCPGVYPYWYDEYDAQIREYAAAHSLTYHNLLEVSDEMGIDYSADTYDAGIHLNESGSVKLCRYLAPILSGELGLPDHRNEPETAAKYAAQ